MARQRKKLKILPVNSFTNENKIHYDYNDSLFASEHYGYYLMCTIPKSSAIKTPRRYIDFDFKKKFYLEKNKLSSQEFSIKPKINRSCILNNRRHHKNFILEVIELIFHERKSVKLTESLLIALGIIIDILEEYNIFIKTVDNIKTEYQLIVYDYMLKENKYKNQDKRDVSRLFAELNILLNGFELIQPKRYGFTNKCSPLRELSSSVMYQLEYHASKELKYIKDKVFEYREYLKQKENILSASNLICTLFEIKEKNNSYHKSTYCKILIKKLKFDYSINASILLKEKLSDSDKNQIKKLRTISMKGISLINKIEFAIAWTKELFPYYPRSLNINEKYQEISDELLARKFIKNEFSITVEEIDLYLYPSRTTIYPLYLLLLIRTGLNSEVLLSWEIKKYNSNYILDGDDLGIMTIVETNKQRSNSLISCVMKNDSDEIRYINFYINWCEQIFNFSTSKNLFQYINRGSSKDSKIEVLNTRILGYMKDSPKSFYKKYEIFNENDERINYIDHRMIRKGHNFQEYLKGKQEFERQIKKKHKSDKTTKNHYEDNSIEWNGLKKHKIAKSQNLLVSIFKGDVSRNESKLSKLFNGSMANCKNNKKPTYANAPELKKNEHCIDWTKCLTSCEQACVIPKIHGPVIYAWIDFMEKQKEDFINEDHWDKEYGFDYSAATDTIKYFTNDEKKFCKLEMINHIEFVKLVLKRTVKIGAIKSA